MFIAMLLVPAMASPCEAVVSMEEAAVGGWLMDEQRACLYRAVRKKKDHEEASRLLLADASARSDEWGWTTLAMEHVARSPADGNVWMELVLEAHRDGKSGEVVSLVNDALSNADAWAEPAEDPRMLSMLRLRTYAALDARRGRGIDDTVVRYAKEWLEVAQERAPAVAWQLAGDTRD